MPITLSFVCNHGHETSSLFKNAAVFKQALKAKTLICQRSDCMPSDFKPLLSAPRINRGTHEVAHERGFVPVEFMERGFVKEAIAMHEGRSQPRILVGETTEKQEETLRKRGLEIHEAPPIIQALGHALKLAAKKGQEGSKSPARANKTFHKGRGRTLKPH